MEEYRLKIRAILQSIFRGKDIASLEYKAIDEDTTLSDLDFRKVRGSVRLSNPENILLPKESEAIVQKFLNSELP